MQPSILEVSILHGRRLHEEYLRRHEDCRRIVDRAADRWSAFERRLNEIEGRVLEGRVAECFKLDQDDLAHWVPGGLRSYGRQRLELSVLIPLQRKMHKHITRALAGEARNPTEDSKCLVVFAVQCDHVLDVIHEAVAADKKLDRRITKTEKDERSRGIISLGMQDTKAVAALKRERPSVWEVARRAIGELEALTQQLNEFVDKEMSQTAIARRLEEAPAILVQSISDWHFEKYSREVDALQSWWNTTKESLTGHSELWESLQGKEGLFIRRIDAGLKQLLDKKKRYPQYAKSVCSSAVIKGTENHSAPGCESWSPQLDANLVLVAKAIGELREGVKSVRNSAMWRVIESGRQLQRELLASKQKDAGTTWEAIAPEESARALLARVDAHTKFPDQCDIDFTGKPLEGEPLEKMLLATLNRLDALMQISTEIRGFFDKCSSAEHARGVSASMDAFARTLAGMQEDLLVVLDDPSAANAAEWLELWEGLDCAGPMRALDDLHGKPLKELSGEAGRRQREHLVLLRGFYSLMESSQGLRSHMVAALAADVQGTSRPTNLVDLVQDASPKLGSENPFLLDMLQSEPPAALNTIPSALGATQQILVRPTTWSKVGRGPATSASAQMVQSELDNCDLPIDSTLQTGSRAGLDLSPTSLQRPQKHESPSGLATSTRTPMAQRGFGPGSPLVSAMSRADSCTGFDRSPTNSTRRPWNFDPSSCREGSWKFGVPVKSFPWSQKSLTQSHSQPSFLGPRNALANDLLEVAPPGAKFVDGQRIPLRPCSSHRRLNPIPLRPGSSQRNQRLPAVAWG
mmetsp:Transcript_19723/g.54221  ORF Transcript_19723/g.54221 Transcript_19723/m.54221 type:complete len:805 (-) Transcript_19723:71-2485(-)